MFDLPSPVTGSWDADPIEAQRLAAMLAETSLGERALDLLVLPPAQSLSLNVVSSCNLSCDCCYADRGGFGPPPAAK